MFPPPPSPQLQDSSEPPDVTTLGTAGTPAERVALNAHADAFAGEHRPVTQYETIAQGSTKLGVQLGNVGACDGTANGKDYPVSEPVYTSQLHDEYDMWVEGAPLPGDYLYVHSHGPGGNQAITGRNTPGVGLPPDILSSGSAGAYPGDLGYTGVPATAWTLYSPGYDAYHRLVGGVRGWFTYDAGTDTWTRVSP